MRAKLRSERKQEAALRNLDVRGACFLDIGGDSAPAPDYTPVAQASEEAARIAAEQADRVLDESKRQYDNNMAVAKPVADAQLALMTQSKTQGDDYYNYLKTYRPLETGMRDTAMAGVNNAGEIQAIKDAGIIPDSEITALTDANQRDLDTLTAGYGANYAADKANIQAREGVAAADVAQAAAQATAGNNRRMAAMGINPASGRFAGANRRTAMDVARASVGAVQSARDAGIQDYRGRVATGAAMRGQNFAQKQAARQANVGTLTSARNMRIQDTSTDWARKLDAAGLVRGMPGASQGAYSLANQSGNSAVANTMAPSSQLQAGTQAAAGLTVQGQGQKLQGLTNIANMQTGAYNASLNNDGGLSSLGSILGGSAALYNAISSKDAKTDKRPVDAEVITKGLQRIPVEAWSYKDGEGDGGEHIGPYAEDVQREFGDAAAPGGKMIDLVTMNGIALAGVKELNSRVKKLEARAGLERRM